MTPYDALTTYALLGIPLGLVLGLPLGLIARRIDGWGGYGSFRRRAARLGHIACVMLPLIAGFYALLLGEAAVGSGVLWAGVGLWVGGGLLLPIALFLAAWRPRLQLVIPVPATALVVGGVCFALFRLVS